MAINLATKMFRMPHEDITKAIDGMNQEVLNEERLLVWLDVCVRARVCVCMCVCVCVCVRVWVYM
jgi:hypothetical protein